MKRRIPLALKLGLAFIGLILFSVVLIYYLTAQSIAQQFDTYRRHNRDQFIEQVTAQLAAYRDWNGSWLGVIERHLTRKVSLQIGEQTIETNVWIYNERFTLADKDGRIITTNEFERQDEILRAYAALKNPERDWQGVYLTKEEIAAGAPIIVDGERAGTLLVGEVGPDLDPHESEFLDSARKSALIGGGVASGIAGLLAIVLISQLLSPLRKLTRATERIAQGDLPRSVHLKSRDEIGQLGTSFDHMVESLRRSETIRQTMTADIAHELRTPVTIIQGTLEAILDGIYESCDETIAPIYEETLQLSRLIDDLRDLALAEAGELRLEREPVDIAALAGQVAETTVSAMEDAPTLRIDARPGLPEVRLDPKRFRQVLANLLSNAVRYTPAEGEIRIDIRRVEEEVELCVSDTGPGIPTEDLPHLFERFYRGDPARGRTAGSGLGLAIVKQWVEAHGGVIWAENRPEGGARFVLQIPIS